VLLSSYFEGETDFPEYNGKEVQFNFDKIRAKGTRISGGGKAPGAEPLKKALGNIKKVLDNAVNRGDGRLKSVEAYDIVMHAADAVISGGVRRSATICLFSPDDKEMATAKTGNWFTDNPQRGRSNNSALLLRDKTTPEQFAELMQSVKQFGEPGFVWADDEDFIVNPCVEIGLYPVDVESVKSGWQGCNLSTVN
jgi:ribonucleoside-diphosphate reductase alpha chain